MKKLAALALAALVAAPSAASAQSAVYLGGRIGYGFPFGTALEVAGQGTSQRDLVKSNIPLEADVGVRFGPIDVGAYLSYGFAKAGSRCGGDCSANELRLGLQAGLNAAMGHERSVWGGVLLGYEKLTVKPKGGGETKASGVQGGVQGGYDFSGSSFGFGPYGQLTVGQYDSFETPAGSVSNFTKKTHGQFVLGVRGYFRI